MFNLFLAIVSSALVSIVMRLSGRRVKSELFMFTGNYLTCSLLGAGFGGLKPFGIPGGGWAIGLGLTAGVLYLATLMLLRACMNRDGVVISGVFMKLGVLVPTLMAVVVFGERPDAYVICGFIIALAAVLTVNGVEKGGGLLPIALLVVGGLTDSLSNIYDKMGTAAHKDMYLFITFSTACVLSIIVGLIKGQRPGVKEFIWGAALGIPNYFCSRFRLAALTTLDAIVVYPVFSIGVLLIISLAGVIAFGERPSKRQIIGLAMIPAALILLNL